MTKRWLATALALSFAGIAAAECAPPKLVRIVTANVSPGLPADSFARKPKVMYRLGNGNVRLEEEPDPAENLHQLIVGQVPNTWQINLITKSGKLLVDRAESKEVHVPIFQGDGVPEEFRDIQFGCELEFIARADTQHERKEREGGGGALHSRTVREWKAALLTRDGREQPIAAMLSREGKVVFAMRYVSYDTMDAVPAGLFDPPQGVTITPGN